MSTVSVTRREFLKTSGLSVSGLILGFPWASGAEKPVGGFRPNAFIAISPEAGVTLYIPVPEVGQNTRTALAMILADELGADLEAVHLRQAGPRNDMGWQMAGASSGLKRSYENLRKSAAAAREMLLAGAATRWNVEPSRCRAEQGKIWGPGSRSVSLEEAAAFGADQPVPENPPLKPSSEFRYIGQPIKVLDARDIGRGKTIFSIDAMPEGVRFAVMRRCPVHGGVLRRYDAGAARSMPGVIEVVQVGDKVAVVATNTWTAINAAKAVRVEWDEGENAGASTAQLVEEQKAAVADPPQTGFTRGDFQAAFAGAPIQLDEEFSAPFLCHSPMEPPNCTAWYREGGIEIWTGCQSLNRLYDELPKYTGLPREKITCHQLRIGGGFGRKLAHDYIIEAVELARLVDYPVKLTFTKEDDIHHSVYRAAERHRYRVGLDARGYPRALQEVSSRRVWADRESKFAVYFEHVERKFDNVRLPVVTGPLRGPNDNVSSFTQQSMTDLMAEAAGIDPMDYRLALVGDPDALRRLGWEKAPAADPVLADLLRIVRDRSGWKTDPAHGYGVSYFEKNDSKVAIVALAPKTQSGRPIDKVFLALHCGRIVNPLSARAQMEGGVIDGLAAALYQKIDIRGGRVVQSNYQDYKMLAMPEAPDIDIHLVESGDEPKGMGETAYPPMMPATVSALCDATGRRTRHLPVMG
jgi:isoquinoline 1-oxidoreductase beta subunit